MSLEMELADTSSGSLTINKIIPEVKFQILFQVDHLKFSNHPVGRYIRSPAFNCGCCSWVFHYYPQGKNTADHGYASIFLVLLSKKEIRVEYSFSIIDKIGMCKLIHPSAVHTFTTEHNISGLNNFVKRDTLNNDYLTDGLIHMCCNIRILTLPDMLCGALQEHFRKLWESGEQFDVTFQVEGECIPAHKSVISRSPVLNAELFGNMAEANMNYIKIEDMKADVFRVLLCFMYTEKLMNGRRSRDADKLSHELLEDLFVAADRYDLEKLRDLCEEQLAMNLSVDTVASTLVLADQHNCAWLKKRCFEFASDLENFMRFALTDGYLHTMQLIPSLFAELRDSNLSCIENNPTKKQRTS